MTDKEKQEFIIKLTLEASKTILSNFDIEKQLKPKTGGGKQVDTYIPYAAAFIVSDFVERTLNELAKRELL